MLQINSTCDAFSSANLSNLTPFKNLILNGMNISQITSLKTDEDWLDLRDEVKDALLIAKYVTILGISISEESSQIDNVEVLSGEKRATLPHKGSRPKEMEDAQTTLPRSIMQALRP